MTHLRAFLALSVAAALAGCGGEGDSNIADGDRPANATAAASRSSVGDVAAQNPDLAQFARAIEAAALTNVLKGGEPYTLFAPVNAAFDAMPEEARTRLMAPEGRGELTDLITVHIVPGVVTARDLDGAIQRGQGRATLATVAGPNITISREGDSYVVTDGAGGRARIVRPDLEASNGVIHQIDALLVPAAPRN